MTLLLDTSVLIDLESGEPSVVEKITRLSQQHSAPAHISFMTYVEFLVGFENASDERKAQGRAFVWKFPLLNTTTETALWLVHLKNKYGGKKSLADLFIASQALEHKLTLVSSDTDFEDISEIKKIIL